MSDIIADMELFDRALDQPEGERDAFIDRVCTDSAQAARIRELLAAHQRVVSDLTAHSAPDLPGLDEIPDFIGPFRVLSRIGEGGMGVVYVGEQTEPIRREVAIKV
ncbi:MAG: hypothetical protein KDA21_15415, partial [Phycisphaerales bacterium]|nr:hypothetical protein [Phycisphaerales bacterium]